MPSTSSVHALPLGQRARQAWATFQTSNRSFAAWSNVFSYRITVIVGQLRSRVVALKITLPRLDGTPSQSPTAQIVCNQVDIS